MERLEDDFHFLKGNTLTFKKIIVPLLNLTWDLVYKMHAHIYMICQRLLESVQLGGEFYVFWIISFIITKVIEKFERVKVQRYRE